MKPCDDIRNQDYGLGLLDENEAAEHVVHLAECRRCTREVEAYRVLFDRLAELPDPPLPAGIPEAVLSLLEPERFWSRVRRRFTLPRPVAAILAGGLAGVVLGFFREPIQLLLGRATRGLVTGGTTDLLDGIRTATDRLTDSTVLLEFLVSWAWKLRPVVHAIGEALPTLAGQTSLLTIGLILATALLFRRLVGQAKREDLSHARR